MLGAMSLASTTKFSDLVLNGVVLAFTLEFDDVLYSVFIPRRTKTLMSNLERLPCRRQNPGTDWSSLNSLWMRMSIFTSMSILWLPLLQRIFLGARTW